MTAGETNFFMQLLPWVAPASHDTKSDCLKYCHYCMDTVTCMSCMANQPVYIPRELHLKTKMHKRRVCQRAYKLLEQHNTVRIDK